jgi:hypothetical protein
MLNQHDVINVLLPLSILCIGLIANTFGLRILLKKRLVRKPANRPYFYLLLIDSIYLLQIIFHFIETNYKYQITTQNVFFCKIFSYFNYSVANLSPMILSYISIDRLISVKLAKYKFILRNNKNQSIFLCFIILYNLFYYLPLCLMLSLSVNSQSNEITIICSINDDGLDFLLLAMDFINRILIPFSIMTISSILLIVTVFTSRVRVMKFHVTNNNDQLKRDLKLAITSISLNIVYIMLNLPILIVEYIETDYDENEDWFNLALCVFFLSYALNFFIITTSNSFIRKEVFIFFKSFTGRKKSKFIPSKIKS